MRRIPHGSRVLVVASVAAVAVAGVFVGRWWSAEEPEPRRLGEARVLADASEYRGFTQFEDIVAGDVDHPTLDQLPLSRASRVVADDTGGFWLLLDQGSAADTGALVRSTADGTVVDAGTTIGIGYPVAFTAGDGVRATGARYSFQDHAVDVYEPPDRSHRWRRFLDPADGATVDLPFPRLGALAVTEDGTVLASAGGEGRIVVLDPDGTVRRDHRGDPPMGQVTAMVPLPDGRIAFAADGDDDFRLYVLDDAGVRPVDTGDTNPVSAEARYDRDGHLVDPAYDQLAPGPAGTLLAIGYREGRSPTISLVDPDSGRTESLVHLTGIEPTPDRPISAAAVGEDLVFLADGVLWTLDDAFAS